jgi:hypothetical protein
LLDVFGTVFKNVMEINHLGDVVEGWEVILKRIVGKYVEGMVWIYLAVDRDQWVLL